MGFRAPLLCMIPPSIQELWKKGSGVQLIYKNQQLPCLCGRGLELSSHWTGRGKDALLIVCGLRWKDLRHKGSKNLLPLPWAFLDWPRHATMVWSLIGWSWHLRPTQGKHRELLTASQG